MGIKIFINPISDKGLTSKIRKMKITVRKQIFLFKNGHCGAGG